MDSFVCSVRWVRAAALLRQQSDGWMRMMMPAALTMPDVLIRPSRSQGVGASIGSRFG